jgi:membrane associated rhomboid family serine protease
MFPVSDVIPSRAKPVATIALIASIIGAFIYESNLFEQELRALIRQFGVVPAAFTWPALACGLFLHISWLHVGANALYLWLFGCNIEDVVGRGRFLIFYLVCGVAAALGHVAAHPLSTLPLVGASGAVAGVLGAYLVMFPGSRVLTAFFPIVLFDLIEVPAAFYVGLWFLLQLFSGLGSIAPEATHGAQALLPNVVGFATGALCGVFSRARGAALKEYWR